MYYVAPFLRWDRGPGEPNQAVLLDFEHGRLYGFFIEIWPQELYYVTGLMILAAAILILANALAAVFGEAPTAQIASELNCDVCG